MTNPQATGVSEMVELVDKERLLAELEKLLRSLLDGEFSSLTISFNDAHAPNYQTAQEWSDDEPPFADYNDLEDWPSAEDREKALATNSVWSCQWYPNTPVGFNRLYASSLPTLVAALRSLSTPSMKDDGNE